MDNDVILEVQCDFVYTMITMGTTNKLMLLANSTSI